MTDYTIAPPAPPSDLPADPRCPACYRPIFYRKKLGAFICHSGHIRSRRELVEFYEWLAENERARAEIVDMARERGLAFYDFLDSAHMAHFRSSIGAPADYCRMLERLKNCGAGASHGPTTGAPLLEGA